MAPDGPGGETCRGFLFFGSQLRLTYSLRFPMFPPMSETKLPEGPEHEVLYTIKEAAGFLRVYHKRIYDWAYEGKIKTVKLGRARRVPASEISRLMRDGFDT